MGEDMNFDMGLPIVDLPQTNNCIIKVIGVGGGGGNAVVGLRKVNNGKSHIEIHIFTHIIIY